MQQQSWWWKLPSGCSAGANNRGGVYFLCKWVAGTHSHPCMHSTQNTELWTRTNTQSSIGGPTEVLYCARMLLKFQRIASARQVCFFAKLVSPPPSLQDQMKTAEHPVQMTHGSPVWSKSWCRRTFTSCFRSSHNHVSHSWSVQWYIFNIIPELRWTEQALSRILRGVLQDDDIK